MAFKINNTTWIASSGIPWSTIQHNLTGNWYKTSKGLNTVYINAGTNTYIGNCFGVNLYRATSPVRCYNDGYFCCCATWSYTCGPLVGSAVTGYAYCIYCITHQKFEGFWRNAVAATSRVDFPNNGDNFNIRFLCS